MFLSAGTGAAARWALTDRLDGVSQSPFDSLNLGDHVGDQPAAVARNRQLLAAAVPARGIRFMRQVHGAAVARVARADPVGPPPQADALVTTDPGVALAVLVADCVPVLLAARRSQVIGVAHAGRRGVLTGVVAATVAAMRDLGARPSRIVARVGPAICGRCYEVAPEVQEEVCQVVPGARATTTTGTTGLDIRTAVVAQLTAAGVEAIEVDPWCTAERDDLYSYRRDGATGRFAGLVWLPES